MDKRFNQAFSNKTNENLILQKNQWINSKMIYGINGLKIKKKIMNIWRQIFLLDQHIVEIELPILSPSLKNQPIGEMGLFSGARHEIWMEYESISKYLGKTINFGIGSVRKSFKKIEFGSFERTLAEIEYFFDPSNVKIPSTNKFHYKLPIVINKKIYKMSVSQMIKKNILKSKIVGHFINIVYHFCKTIGLNKIRFKSSLNEWELECEANPNEWFTCIRIANRGELILGKPSLDEQVWVATIEYIDSNNMKNSRIIKDISKVQHERIKKEKIWKMEIKGTTYFIPSKDVKFVESKKKNYPNVMELIFSIDLLFRSIFTQNYKVRENSAYCLSIPLSISIYDVALFKMFRYYKQISSAYHKIDSELRKFFDVIYYDDSDIDIEKKYIKADELGIPYSVIVDSNSVKNFSVLVRNRDTLNIERVSLRDLKFI